MEKSNMFFFIFATTTNVKNIVMKHRIILFFALLLIAPSAYSQHLAKAIPVDIPLNSSKQSAINKLLKNNYELSDAGEKEGFDILYYRQKYNGQTVGLWMKNNLVSMVEWPMKNMFEIDDVAMELEKVYGINPYKRTERGGSSESLPKDYIERYYYWKKYTIILEKLMIGSKIYIISNSDANKRIEKANGEGEKK